MQKIKKLLKLLSFLGTSLLAAACAQPREPVEVGEPEPAVTASSTLVYVQCMDVLDSGQVEGCAEPLREEGCPEGMIVVRSSSPVARCFSLVIL